MLPHDKKNSWKGVRTTGELKRDKGIRNLSEENSLYKVVLQVLCINYLWYLL